MSTVPPTNQKVTYPLINGVNPFQVIYVDPYHTYPFVLTPTYEAGLASVNAQTLKLVHRDGDSTRYSMKFNSPLKQFAKDLLIVVDNPNVDKKYKEPRVIALLKAISASDQITELDQSVDINNFCVLLRQSGYEAYEIRDGFLRRDLYSFFSKLVKDDRNLTNKLMSKFPAQEELEDHLSEHEVAQEEKPKIRKPDEKPRTCLKLNPGWSLKEIANKVINSHHGKKASVKQIKEDNFRAAFFLESVSVSGDIKGQGRMPDKECLIKLCDGIYTADEINSGVFAEELRKLFYALDPATATDITDNFVIFKKQKEKRVVVKPNGVAAPEEHPLRLIMAQVTTPGKLRCAKQGIEICLNDGNREDFLATAERYTSGIPLVIDEWYLKGLAVVFLYGIQEMSPNNIRIRERNIADATKFLEELALLRSTGVKGTERLFCKAYLSVAGVTKTNHGIVTMFDSIDPPHIETVRSMPGSGFDDDIVMDGLYFEAKAAMNLMRKSRIEEISIPKKATVNNKKRAVDVDIQTSEYLIEVKTSLYAAISDIRHTEWQIRKLYALGDSNRKVALLIGNISDKLKAGNDIELLFELKMLIERSNVVVLDNCGKDVTNNILELDLPQRDSNFDVLINAPE